MTAYPISQLFSYRITGARSSHGLEFPTKPSFRIGPNCGPCKPSLPSICPEVGNAVTLIQEIPLEGSILLNDS